jgi:hypothetical protein
LPGDPAFYMAPGIFAGGSPGGVTASANGVVNAGSTHWGFIFWLVLLGVVIPVAILGGLQIGGFSFVFRHR